jgi:hypothetical protein
MAGTPGEEPGRDPAGDLGDPWSWGLEASRLMSQRLLELYSEVGEATFSRFNRDGGDDLRQIRIDLERWVDLSVELFDRAFVIMRRLGENGHDDGASAANLSLVGSAGATSVGELWVHNVADAARTPPALRCAGLSSVQGEVISGSQVRFDVDMRPLNGQTSRKVAVVVAVPASAPPGIYHGLVLSAASPDSAVPLRVEVRDGCL